MMAKHPGIREHHGGFQVRYRDADGIQHAQTFRNITDARNFQKSVHTDVRRGDWFDPKLAQTPFRAHAAAWMATTVHLRPSTRASYEVLLRRHVMPYFGGRTLGSIARVDVQAWMADRIAAGVGPGSVRNAYRVLSRILSEAERARMIPRNPALRVPLPRSTRDEMHFLTPGQIGRLADAVDARFHALILMAGFTGLRFGELAALRIERLNLLRGSVDVRESLSEVRGQIHVLPTKTGERRTVPLPRFLCAALDEQIAHFPAATATCSRRRTGRCYGGTSTRGTSSRR